MSNENTNNSGSLIPDVPPPYTSPVNNIPPHEYKESDPIATIPKTVTKSIRTLGSFGQESHKDTVPTVMPLQFSQKELQSVPQQSQIVNKAQQSIQDPYFHSEKKESTVQDTITEFRKVALEIGNTDQRPNKRTSSIEIGNASKKEQSAIGMDTLPQGKNSINIGESKPSNGKNQHEASINSPDAQFSTKQESVVKDTETFAKKEESDISTVQATGVKSESPVSVTESFTAKLEPFISITSSLSDKTETIIKDSISTEKSEQNIASVVTLGKKIEQNENPDPIDISKSLYPIKDVTQHGEKGEYPISTNHIPGAKEEDKIPAQPFDWAKASPIYTNDMLAETESKGVQNIPVDSQIVEAKLDNTAPISQVGNIAIGNVGYNILTPESAQTIEDGYTVTVSLRNKDKATTSNGGNQKFAITTNYDPVKAFVNNETTTIDSVFTPSRTLPISTTGVEYLFAQDNTGYSLGDHSTVFKVDGTKSGGLDALKMDWNSYQSNSVPSSSTNYINQLNVENSTLSQERQVNYTSIINEALRVPNSLLPYKIETGRYLTDIPADSIRSPDDRLGVKNGASTFTSTINQVIQDTLQKDYDEDYTGIPFSTYDEKAISATQISVVSTHQLPGATGSARPEGISENFSFSFNPLTQSKADAVLYQVATKYWTPLYTGNPITLTEHGKTVEVDLYEQEYSLFNYYNAHDGATAESGFLFTNKTRSNNTYALVNDQSDGVKEVEQSSFSSIGVSMKTAANTLVDGNFAYAQTVDLAKDGGDQAIGIDTPFKDLVYGNFIYANFNLRSTDIGTAGKTGALVSMMNVLNEQASTTSNDLIQVKDANGKVIDQYVQYFNTAYGDATYTVTNRTPVIGTGGKIANTVLPTNMYDNDPFAITPNYGGMVVVKNNGIDVDQYIQYANTEYGDVDYASWVSYNSPFRPVEKTPSIAQAGAYGSESSFAAPSTTNNSRNIEFGGNALDGLLSGGILQGLVTGTGLEGVSNLIGTIGSTIANIKASISGISNNVATIDDTILNWGRRFGTASGPGMSARMLENETLSGSSNSIVGTILAVKDTVTDVTGIVNLMATQPEGYIAMLTRNISLSDFDAATIAIQGTAGNHSGGIINLLNPADTWTIAGSWAGQYGASQFNNDANILPGLAYARAQFVKNILSGNNSDFKGSINSDLTFTSDSQDFQQSLNVTDPTKVLFTSWNPLHDYKYYFGIRDGFLYRGSTLNENEVLMDVNEKYSDIENRRFTNATKKITTPHDVDNYIDSVKVAGIKVDNQDKTDVGYYNKVYGSTEFLWFIYPDVSTHNSTSTLIKDDGTWNKFDNSTKDRFEQYNPGLLDNHFGRLSESSGDNSILESMYVENMTSVFGGANNRMLFDRTSEYPDDGNISFTGASIAASNQLKFGKDRYLELLNKYRQDNGGDKFPVSLYSNENTPNLMNMFSSGDTSSQWDSKYKDILTASDIRWLRHRDDSPFYDSSVPNNVIMGNEVDTITNNKHVITLNKPVFDWIRFGQKAADLDITSNTGNARDKNLRLLTLGHISDIIDKPNHNYVLQDFRLTSDEVIVKNYDFTNKGSNPLTSTSKTGFKADITATYIPNTGYDVDNKTFFPIMNLATDMAPVEDSVLGIGTDNPIFYDTNNKNNNTYSRKTRKFEIRPSVMFIGDKDNNRPQLVYDTDSNGNETSVILKETGTFAYVMETLPEEDSQNTGNTDAHEYRFDLQQQIDFRHADKESGSLKNRLLNNPKFMSKLEFKQAIAKKKLDNLNNRIGRIYIIDAKGKAIDNIVLQFDVELTGESRSANWQSHTAMGRTSDYFIWANTNSRTISLKTIVAVMTPNDGVDKGKFVDPIGVNTYRNINPLYLGWADMWTPDGVKNTLDKYRSLVLPEVTKNHYEPNFITISNQPHLQTIGWNKGKTTDIKWIVTDVNIEPKQEAGYIFANNTETSPNKIYVMWDISMSLREVPVDWATNYGAADFRP